MIGEIAPSVEEKVLSSYWSIETVDSVTGLVFEKIICDLYNAMKNFSAEKTPDSNDFGADVVVKSLTDNTGLLIQCKHIENPDSSVNNKGVQEIFAAVAYYEKKYCGRKFQPVVVTNFKMLRAELTLKEKSYLSTMAVFDIFSNLLVRNSLF